VGRVFFLFWGESQQDLRNFIFRLEINGERLVSADGPLFPVVF
tara:strand:+ start:463 stop:591 length:129 start_codon:yes stop_codon:yes gene_type:complete